MAMNGQNSEQDSIREDVKDFLVKAGLIEGSPILTPGAEVHESNRLYRLPNFLAKFPREFSLSLSNAAPGTQWRKLWDGIEAWCRKPPGRSEQIDPKEMLEKSIRRGIGCDPKLLGDDKQIVDLFLNRFQHLVKQHIDKTETLVDKACEAVKHMSQPRDTLLTPPPSKGASPPTGMMHTATEVYKRNAAEITGSPPPQGQRSAAGTQSERKEKTEPKLTALPEATAVSEDRRVRISDQSTTLSVIDTGQLKVIIETSQTIPTPPPPPPLTPSWKYLPVPDDEPDKHSEYDVRSGRSPEGMHIIGARVRGKKHKHEGTNCDDWFEFAVAGKWSIFAVADGGGSYKFSRVGAEAACKGSVSYLKEILEGVIIKPLKKLTQDIMNDESVMKAKIALHEGLKRGWQSIEKAFQERDNSKLHYKALQHRDMTLKDMYSTLLLAVHTSFETADGSRSLVLSCAGGDGMIAVINKDGYCNLLMKPDTGEFSGEVEFLGPQMLTEEVLASRTFPFAGGIKALMLMTDGVADDYFPNSPNIAGLYVDLVLNKIIPVGSFSEGKIVSELKAAKLPNPEAMRRIDFFVESERLLEKPEKLRLASAKKFAEAIGMQPDELARRPDILANALAIHEGSRPSMTLEQRFLEWLDSYHVKGSFDDRTLIIMAPPEDKK